MSTYDDGEGATPGDPTWNDIDPKQIEKLQKRIDQINEETNPVEKDKLVKKLVDELNHKVHKCPECGAEYVSAEAVETCNHKEKP